MVYKIRYTIVVLLLLILAAIVAAVPDGDVAMTLQNSTRRVSGGATSISAEAGNVSWLTLDGKSVTQSWQGFVGNVTGSITLDDAYNFTLYDWSLSSPSGEVYATYLTSVDWTTGYVQCWNWSNLTVSYLRLEELEQHPNDPSGNGVPSDFSGMRAGATDVDGMDETFNYTMFNTANQREHTTFFVGGQLINGTLAAGTFDRGINGGEGPCPNARIYNGTHHGGVSGDAADLPLFEEVLLYYGNNAADGDGVIFTSILQSDKNGYNNATWDFEMLVPENGHLGNTTMTTYYFYVELQ